VLWEHRFDAATEGVPAIYEVGGRQYITVPVGGVGHFLGGLIVVTLSSSVSSAPGTASAARPVPPAAVRVQVRFAFMRASYRGSITPPS
jgi:hypothetical protein